MVLYDNAEGPKFDTNGPSGLLVLAHDNEGYKRISITPSPESSLAMH